MSTDAPPALVRVREAHLRIRGEAIAAALVMTLVLACAVEARSRQLGALVSPGPLSAPHADLEGIQKCQACHEPGRRVSPARCLTCHKPIAQRIAARRGVHRNVKDDCVRCHVEHMGREAELRPFDTRSFDHARETGYALEGGHARVAGTCNACHKTRSFLSAPTACAACHQDPHKGALGRSCERCHAVADAFTEAIRTFDHDDTAFPLAGAHERLACAACHEKRTYAETRGAACATCHSDPHERRLGTRCETCHGVASWRTARFDHDRTGYSLIGRHAQVACTACHVRPALKEKPRHDRCAACHADPHDGVFKQDCAACHSEHGFANAPFDHGVTPFPLTGAHATARCAACHKGAGPASSRGTPARVDFRGLRRECIACHADPHAGEFRASCDTCHTTARFRPSTFAHDERSDFFGGAHAGVTCAQCHPAARLESTETASALPSAGYAAAKRTCVSCHADVHLGQVGTSCETCHAVAKPDFALAGFDHARTRFQLRGRHAVIECRKCHPTVTATFPAGSGTAVRLNGMGTACVSCHADPHAGQLGPSCETCHSTDTFHVRHYTHRDRSLRAFFEGAHARARCDQCHRSAPAAPGSAHTRVIQYRIETRCAACHTDPHAGQLGDRCTQCHRAGVTTP